MSDRSARAPSAYPDAGTGPRPAARDRIRCLLEAQRTISTDLSLPAMLEQILRAACGLVGARRGAVSLLGDDGQLDRRPGYVAVRGLTDESVDGLSTDPEIRTAVFVEACDDDRLYIAIPARGVVVAHLYLAGSVAGAFEQSDEDIVTALASFAGSAIDNARLYADAQRSKDWLHASGEIARALLADADANALMEVVSRALHVAEADYAALILPTAQGQLKVSVTVGLGAEEFHGRLFDPTGSELGRAIVGGRSLLTRDMAGVSGTGYINNHDYGPVMVAPLVDAQGVRGGVLLIRTVDRLPFTPRDLDLATTFADQVALALQLNDSRLDARSLHVLEDRHELSRALHDSVMQRLFATGVGLQGLADRDLPVQLAERLRRHICDLDETIEEIRARVFKAAESRPDEHDRFARVPHDARMVGA